MASQPAQSTTQDRTPAPPARELKCTLCGLTACWTKRDDEPPPRAE